MIIRAIPQVDASDDDKMSVPWLILHCLGFGACWAWVHVCFFSSTLLADAVDAGLAAWLSNLVANAVAMVVFGLLSRRHGPLVQSRSFGAAAALAVAVGSFAMAFLYGRAPFALWLAAGPVATGVGTAGLILLWAEAYGDIAPSRAKRFTLPGSMLTGVVLYLFITALSSTMSVIATALLPLASLLCLRSTYDAEAGVGVMPGGPSSPTGERRPQIRALGKFMLIVAVYCLPSGFMTGRPVLLESSMSSLGTVMFGGIALLLLAVAFGGIVFARPAGEDFMYRLIVPLLAAGLLLVPFVTNVAQGVAGIAIMGGYIILEMYVWSALQDIARKGPDGPALVYGVGKTGMNLGLFVGCLLGMYAYGQSTVLVLGVSVAIVYAFILLGSLGPRASGPRLAPLLATESELDVRSDGQTAPSADVRAIIEAARASRCDELAGLYGLSQRERDVLELLACGRSLDAIAASLGIAQSTVRSHRDHIYRKLGIHGRQELIDLLEGE